jgi:ABC-type Mn2+/Zn2+ transport systems, permease components
MINEIVEMFSYGFIQRALIVGALVTLCSSLLGVSLVLKRYSMIGDGLSHTAFGAMSIIVSLNSLPFFKEQFNLNPLLCTIILVIIVAFFLLRITENSKITSDSAIALISTSSLALGVIVITFTTGLSTDVCNTLFGTILALSKTDVIFSVILSIVVLVLFSFFYNKIFAVTFDENFAKATGIKVNIYNMLIALLTAITIVIGMRLMGSLLISSLIVIPSLTSMRLFKTFKGVVISSATISLVCFFIGMILSYLFKLPTGASIVMINVVMFLLFTFISFINKKVG